jgi:N-methylhydantoinase A
VDLRYRGQGYELNLPFSKNLLQEFEREHQRRYGYAHAGRELELVTIRLRAVLKATTNRGAADAFARPGPGRSRRSGREHPGTISAPNVRVTFEGKKLKTAIYSRDALHVERKYSGPAIVTEYSATTVVPPRMRFHTDRVANLVIAL